MKITILNGNPDAENTAFEDYLKALCGAYEARGHSAEVLMLRELDIKHCLGCWSCWVKTPGFCAVKDDSEIVCRSYINADLVVFASPVIMGFTSALMKKAQDKLIPLILPHIEVDHGECHHVARYEKYPAIGLLLQRNGCDDEDIGIITDIYSRIAWNFKTRLAFSGTMDKPVGEVAHEADGI